MNLKPLDLIDIETPKIGQIKKNTKHNNVTPCASGGIEIYDRKLRTVKANNGFSWIEKCIISF